MRGLLAWLAPGACAALTWWIFLGNDDNDVYTVGQVVPVVVILIALGVLFGWFADRMTLLPIIVSSVVGLCSAVYASWSDDETGTFMVGVILVGIGAAVVASALVVGTWAVRQNLLARSSDGA